MSPPDRPHRRRNPLTGRHVLVSPQRATRPWLGAQEAVEDRGLPAHDPGCALCPGNRRAGGETNPDFTGPFAFDNDFPAMGDAELGDGAADPLFGWAPVTGMARVITYSPDHRAGLTDLSAGAARALIECWCAEVAAAGKRFPHVQLFENRGAMMGCSNPHPHGQLWASTHAPDEAALEDAHQRAYTSAHGSALLGDALEAELADGSRIVAVNTEWAAWVPFWASWPFETIIVPRRAVARLPDCDDGARVALAAMLGQLVRGYDRLFACPFPYSMGWHGAPFDGTDARHWTLHAHVYPPLLRSATVRKFMVGYELLAEAQRDLTPETAAERLRAVMA